MNPSPAPPIAEQLSHLIPTIPIPRDTFPAAPAKLDCSGFNMTGIITRRTALMDTLVKSGMKPEDEKQSADIACSLLEVITIFSHEKAHNLPETLVGQSDPIDRAIGLLMGSFTHPPVPNSNYSYAGEIFLLLPKDERMMNPQDIIYNYSQVCREMNTVNKSGTPLSRELKQRAAAASLRMISLLGSNEEFQYKDMIASKVAGVIKNNHLGEEIGEIVGMKREETAPTVPEEKPPDLPTPPPTELAIPLPKLESPPAAPPSAAPPEHEDTLLLLKTKLAEETRLKIQAEEENTRLKEQLTAAKAAGEKAEQETAALLKTQLESQVREATQAPEKPGEKTFSDAQEQVISLREAGARAAGVRDGQRLGDVEAEKARKLADEAHQLALKSLKSAHAHQITALQDEFSAAETNANTQTQETAVKLKAAEQRAREAESARDEAKQQAEAAKETLAAANEALARGAQAITAQQAEMSLLEGNNAEQKKTIADLEAQLRMQLAGEQDILQRLSEASEAQKGGITLDPAARQIIAEALAIENYSLDSLTPELAAFIAELKKSLEKIVEKRAKEIVSRTGRLKTKGPPKPDQEPASAPNPDAGGFEDIEL